MPQVNTNSIKDKIKAALNIRKSVRNIMNKRNAAPAQTGNSSDSEYYDAKPMGDYDEFQDVRDMDQYLNGPGAQYKNKITYAKSNNNFGKFFKPLAKTGGNEESFYTDKTDPSRFDDDF